MNIFINDLKLKNLKKMIKSSFIIVLFFIIHIKSQSPGRLNLFMRIVFNF
jgi:hypothetical protein